MYEGPLQTNLSSPILVTDIGHDDFHLFIHIRQTTQPVLRGCCHLSDQKRSFRQNT